MKKNNKDSDDRKWLDKVIPIACKKIMDIAPDKFTKEKVFQLGQLVTDLRKENEELQAWEVPSTLLEQLAERRSKIEYVVA